MTGIRSALTPVLVGVVFATVGLIAACSRGSREADIKECVAKIQKQEAQGQNFTQQPGENTEQRHDRLGQDVADCMEKRGYRHDDSSMADERCIDDVDYNPYCYSRRN